MNENKRKFGMMRGGLEGEMPKGTEYQRQEIDNYEIWEKSSLPNKETVLALFEVKKWSGEILNTEPDKCDDLRWFPLDNLPVNTIPYIKQAIECYRKGILYSEFGW